MTTQGIEGLLIETHNWGKTVAFWQALGFVLEFETDHHSGQLRHPHGGPYLFIAERPDDAALTVQPVLAVADSAAFSAPSAGTVLAPFEAQHWPVLASVLADPDGRPTRIHAPLPEGMALAAEHGADPHG
jgi:hypothetical protein